MLIGLISHVWEFEISSGLSPRTGNSISTCYKDTTSFSVTICLIFLNKKRHMIIFKTIYDLLKLTSSENRKKPAKLIKHIQQILIFNSEHDSSPSRIHNCFKISYVMYAVFIDYLSPYSSVATFSKRYCKFRWT